MRNPTRPLALASLPFVAVFAMLAYGVNMPVCAAVGAALCALTFGYTLFYGKNMKKAVAAVIFAAAFCVFGLISGSGFANEVSFSRSLVSENEHNIVFEIDEISYAAPYGSRYYATCNEIDGKSEKIRLCVELPFDAGLCENDVAYAVGTFESIDEYTAFF
ncbi:MAG: hypothetical protein KBS59_08010, partial [Clostridiales bacterium]|nr:hypothetical protein [Clostridiales bacterium]